ncbi:MAG: DUF3710 domain-containing protein [Mycobacteriaceae bacterium]
MFGRRNKPAQDAPPADDSPAEAMEVDEDGSASGPYDESEVDVVEGESDGRLDLGSVRLPLVEAAQIQVELEETGDLRALHLLTEVGRITVAAFAAPRTEGMWREVVGELAQSLKDDGAVVRFEDGPWGREVVGVGEAATLRFIGVDGPRWMVRCVAAGPEETQEPLTELARSVLQDTVVVRGVEPMPVRTPLPVALPTVLAEQLEQARQQQDAAEQPAPAQTATEPPAPTA